MDFLQAMADELRAIDSLYEAEATEIENIIFRVKLEQGEN